MAKFVERLSSKRVAYQKLPAPLRAMVMAFSILLGVAALPLLTIPFIFDLGVLMLLLSLSLLSLQFDWAHRVLVAISNKLGDKAFRKRLLIVLLPVFIVVASIIVWYFVKK